MCPFRFSPFYRASLHVGMHICIFDLMLQFLRDAFKGKDLTTAVSDMIFVCMPTIYC